MKKIIILSLFSVASFFSFGQAAPPIQWQQCYGVADDELIYAIDTLQNGAGYFFCGRGNCTNNTTADFWVVKTDSLGQVVWQQCYDNQGNVETATSIATTDDGGCIVIGVTAVSISSDRDLWVIKIDAQGTLVWQKTLGGSQDDAGGVPKVVRTADGNYVAGSWTQSNDGDVSGNHGGWDLWLQKFTGAGNILWKKTIGSSADDKIMIVNTTQDGSVLVGGSVFAADGDVQTAYSIGNGWVAKVSAAGSIVWQYTIGDSVNSNNVQSACETKDGGYVFSLDNYDAAPYGGHILMKIDAADNVVWQKTRLNFSWEPVSVLLLHQASDSGFILGGWRYRGLSENDSLINYYMARVDAAGETLWEKAYGGSNHDGLMQAKQTVDGGYVLAGYTLSNDGNVSGNHGGRDGWVVKLKPDALTNVADMLAAPGNIIFYPNPATDVIHFSEKVTVSIINQQGQTVLREYDVQQIPINRLAAGTYFILLSDSKGQIRKVERMTKM